MSRLEKYLLTTEDTEQVSIDKIMEVSLENV